MSHHLYHTDGYILGSAPSGEANKTLFLFTRDLGMIVAAVQGVRFLKSKLRYHLQDFSECRVSLVRGREVWRLTNAALTTDLHREFSSRRECLTPIANIFSLLRRLLHGEEKNEELFATLKVAFAFLSAETLSPDEVQSFEAILVLRVLKLLGYIGAHRETEQFLDHTTFSAELLALLKPVRREVLLTINRSLAETHL